MYYNLRCAPFKICILAEIARCKPQFVVLFLLFWCCFLFSLMMLCVEVVVLALAMLIVELMVVMLQLFSFGHTICTIVPK